MRHLPAVRRDQLDRQTAELLPARETLCQAFCINVAPVVGVNLAIAVNAATINSNATAIANQAIGVWQ
jgi:hypothetical protein